MTTDTPPPLTAQLDDQAAGTDAVSRETEATLEEARPLVDAEEVAKSLTGFDEIAIRQAFKADLSDMGETTMMRATWFIVRRREGALDVEAFREAMTMTLGDLMPRFYRPDRKDGEHRPEA